ncbi:MAG TPA: hypothetical protein VGP62_10295 [Bryobacteraceae bacterium]|nr:hypothetical protein [Bryobacteraceae bacterium]
MVDLTSAPVIEVQQILRDPVGAVTAFKRYGGPVIEMDTSGAVVSRSIAHFRPAPVSLAPDGEHFAILSPPLDHPDWPGGFYIGGFHDSITRNLVSLKYPDRYDSFAKLPIADWSPRGDTLLFSHLGTISLVDVQTGRSRKLADGGAAMWSPSGDWISYVTVKSEVTLLNPSTGESKRIDPGKQMQWLPKWSPDGKYLLVPEGEGSHVVYGCLWVYRVSDGAWAPLPDFNPFMQEWYWIELQASKM